MSINASCLGLCRISAALAHLQSAGVGWNINSKMVFVGVGVTVATYENCVSGAVRLYAESFNQYRDEYV